MKPTTLRERVDLTVEEFAKDPIFFSGVLDGLLEKKASTETPAEVLRIVSEIEKETGMEKEAATRIAWETYLRYVNPDFVKAGGKVPPQFMKKKEEPKKKGEEKKPGHKSAAAAELALKLGVAATKAAAAPPEKKSAAAAAEKAKPDHAPKYKTAGARSLAESLGV